MYVLCAIIGGLAKFPNSESEINCVWSTPWLVALSQKKKITSAKEMRQGFPSFHSALCSREVTSQMIYRALLVCDDKL
jgi:hypothetical protein